MALDTSTLYLIAALVAALLGAMLLFFGRQQRLPALNWWGAAYLVGSASISLSMLAAGAGEWANLLIAAGFVASAMVWNAARVFHGRPPNLGGLAIGAVVWIAAATSLSPSADAARMTVGAAIVAAYAMLTAHELWSERRRGLKRRWPAAAVPVLHGLVLLLPVLIGDLMPLRDGRFDINLWGTAFAVELVLYSVGTVFVVLMLASERAVSQHRVAASCDPLTGMFNRRGFAEATARVIEREAHAGRPVTVMIFDIDHFKSINDSYGHPAGDEIIKLFATVLTHSLRITDLSGRIGGEEFAALLPCAMEDAMIAAERVRAAFQNCNIVADDVPVDTTVSIGVAGGPPGTELEVLLAAADSALYRAKRGGRNRAVAAVEEPISLAQGRRQSAGRAVVAQYRSAPAVALG